MQCIHRMRRAFRVFFEVTWPHKTDHAIFNFFHGTSLQHTFYVTFPDTQMKLGKEKYCSLDFFHL